jgi:hypothetical protein
MSRVPEGMDALRYSEYGNQQQSYYPLLEITKVNPHALIRTISERRPIRGFWRIQQHNRCFLVRILVAKYYARSRKFFLAKKLDIYFL